MENKNNFSYTYSAKEQEEIKKIRERYIAPEEKKIDKMEQLRQLDKSVTQKGTVVSLIFGIIGILVFGTGMSMCLVWSDLFVIGIVIGIIGVAVLSLAYPLYSRITQKERERIAPEIIRLTDELMK